MHYVIIGIVCSKVTVQVMKTDSKYNHVPRWFEYISQLGASLLVDATGRLFRDNDYIHRPNAVPCSKPKVNLHVDQNRLAKSKQDPLKYDSEDEELDDAIGSENLDLIDQGPSAPGRASVKTNSQSGTAEEKTTLQLVEDNVEDDGQGKRNNTKIDAVDSAPGTPRPGHYECTMDTNRTKLHGQPLLTLEYLVSSMSIFDVTKPHDSIYALLGISKDTTPTAANKMLRVTDHTQAALEMFTAKKQYPVDYSASYIDICKEFIQFCVRRNLSRDPSRALDVICRPWAVDVDEKDSDVPLPTWLPRLSKASYGMDRGPGIDGLRMGRKNADSLVGLPNVTHRNYNAAETKGLDRKAFRFRKRVVDPKKPSEFSNHFSLYVKGFVLDTIENLQPASQSGSIPTTWAGFAGWTDMHGTPPEHFWRTLVADRGSGGRNPPVYYSRACQESFRKGNTSSGVVDTTGLIEHERNSVVAQFSRRVQAAIWNRALTRTKIGRFGLVASEVKEGDFVCILYGCSVPVVLRKSERKTPAVIRDEMQAELKYIVHHVEQSYYTHLRRREVFREKRTEDRKKYELWEKEKREAFCKDKAWSSYWRLYRAGIIAIHKYRAWVLKNYVTQREICENAKRKQEIIAVMRDCVNVLLSKVQEIARSLSEQQKKIKQSGMEQVAMEETKLVVQRLRLTATEVPKPEHAGSGVDHGSLWDKFSADEIWQQKWNAEMERYCKREGFLAWIRHENDVNGRGRNHKDYLRAGYANDRQRSLKAWEDPAAQEWTRTWISENSWFLCVDPFRAWLREHGKFSGTEGELDLLQEWEAQTQCKEPFEQWKREHDSKGANPKSIENDDDAEEYKQLLGWQTRWRAKNPRGKVEDMLLSWPEAWKVKKKEVAERRQEANRRLGAEVEREEKKRFLERWKKGWRPPTVNWREFELALSYGRFWLKLIRRPKKDHVEAEGKRFAMDDATRLRQEQRLTYMRSRYGVTASESGLQDGSARPTPTQRNGTTSHTSVARDSDTTIEPWSRDPGAPDHRLAYVVKMSPVPIQAQHQVGFNDAVGSGDDEAAEQRLSQVVEHDSSGTLSSDRSLNTAQNTTTNGYQSGLSVGANADMHRRRASFGGIDTTAGAVRESRTPDEGLRSADFDFRMQAPPKPSRPAIAPRGRRRSLSAWMTPKVQAAERTIPTGKSGRAKTKKRKVDEHKDEVKGTEVDQRNDDQSALASNSQHLPQDPSTAKKLEEEITEWGKRISDIVDSPFQDDGEPDLSLHDRSARKWRRWEDHKLKECSAQILKDQIIEKQVRYPHLWDKTIKEIDAKYARWKKSVPHIMGRGKGLPFDFSRVPTAHAQWTQAQLDRGRVVYSVWIDDKEITFGKPRFPSGHFFKTKIRDRLPEKHEHELTTTQYMEAVHEKFQKNLGTDGEYYYEMLGECYIHGMMDGEAMAHQNNEGIPTTVFEIR